MESTVSCLLMMQKYINSKLFIRLLTGLVNGSNHTKCTLLSN